jgi:hypothetical protein
MCGFDSPSISVFVQSHFFEDNDALSKFIDRLQKRKLNKTATAKKATPKAAATTKKSPALVQPKKLSLKRPSRKPLSPRQPRPSQRSLPGQPPPQISNIC